MSGKQSPDCFLTLLALAQFPNLPLQRFHLLCHVDRDASALVAVDLGLLDPFVQGLRRIADLCRNRHDCLPARFILTLIVENQEHCTLRHFGKNLFIVLLPMLHPTQKLEPPANPAWFTFASREANEQPRNEDDPASSFAGHAKIVSDIFVIDGTLFLQAVCLGNDHHEFGVNSRT